MVCTSGVHASTHGGFFFLLFALRRFWAFVLISVEYNFLQVGSRGTLNLPYQHLLLLDEFFVDFDF